MEKLIPHVTVGDIQTNCWLYPLQSDPAGGAAFRPCALVDPGAEAGRIIAALHKFRLKPAYILLTHGHFDHLAALPALAAAYSEAPIAIHRLDGKYLGPGAYEVHCRSFAAAGGGSSYIDSLWEDMPSPGLLLEEGSVIGPFTVLHLPGHTPGSVGFYDKNGKALFSGDTLFQGTWGRTDLPGGDEEQIMASLKRLLAMDRDITVYPGHGNVTRILFEQDLLGY
jgi:glyoxylase-like metal-dependent hydrolase (beta-lactamase superfamily II)